MMRVKFKLKPETKSKTKYFGVFLLTLLLTYFYLAPGVEAMLEGREDRVMSDGTDAVSLPGAYDALIQVWKEHPSRMFYGSVYMDKQDTQNGSAYTAPWNERWLVVLSSYFVPVEQLSTALVVWLMWINVIAMYLLGRYLGWPSPIRYGLSIAWAFCCYTRARAKVHMALAGTYHLPLIFLGLLLVTRGRSKKSLIGAMIAFLLAGTVGHYYILTCLFLSPFFLIFLCCQPTFFQHWKLISLRMAIAIAPILAFLLWNYEYAVPSYAKVTSEEAFNQGVIRPEQIELARLFLKTYVAKPIDFLGGDISLADKPDDLNPLREIVNEEILSSLGRANSHERTNGIRWLVILISCLGLIALIRKQFWLDLATRRNLWYFFAFGLFTLWLSLGPDVPFENTGPAYWLWSIFHKMRVTSRAGINVHFSLLVITGFILTRYITAHPRLEKLLLYPGVFIGLIVLDGFPLQKMPMAPVQAAYESLGRQHGPCGIGMAFPFFNPVYSALLSYQVTQKMRGSDCALLNLTSNDATLRLLTTQFPPTDAFIRNLGANTKAADELIALAKCMPLNWIVFHQVVPPLWASNVCQRLDWKMTSEGVCISPDRNRPLLHSADNCPRL